MIQPIEIEVENIGGAVDASFKVEKITLLQGFNKNAKSSILYAAALGASQSTSDDPKGDVRDGASSGTVRIKKGGDVTELWISKEDGKQDLKGQAIRCSRVAVGLDNIGKMDQAKDRFRTLAKALHAEPTYKDVETELMKSDLFNKDFVCSKCAKPVDDEPEHRKACKAEDGEPKPTLIPIHVKNAWRVICPPETKEIDFEGAYNAYYENRKTLKQNWRKVTTENYGVEKGETWAPKGFSAKELKESSVDELQKAVDDAKQIVLKTAGQAAVAEADIKKAKERAAKLPELEASLESILSKKKAVELQMEANKPAEVYRNVACQHCKEAQDIIDGVSYPPGSQPVRDAEKYEALSREFRQLQDSIRIRELEVETAKSAKTKLESAVDAKPTEGVNEAQEQLKAAEVKLAAWRDWERARLIHVEILRAEALVKLTAPDGLSASKLGPAIAKFNKELQEICELGGWDTVKIERDGNVSYLGRKYKRASLSERFRIRATLQIGFALFDDSELIILDGLDCLIGENGAYRTQFLSMLYDMQIKAIVSCSLEDESEMIDMEGYGYGHSLWVEKGRIKEVAVATG